MWDCAGLIVVGVQFDDNIIIMYIDIILLLHAAKTSSFTFSRTDDGRCTENKNALSFGPARRLSSTAKYII